MLIGCDHASQPCHHLLCLFTVLQASLDRQVRDLQSQLDEATGSAARAAKKEAASLRQRVSEHACKCMDTHTQTHTRTHTHTLTHRHIDESLSRLLSGRTTCASTELHLLGCSPVHCATDALAHTIPSLHFSSARECHPRRRSHLHNVTE